MIQRMIFCKMLSATLLLVVGNGKLRQRLTKLEAPARIIHISYSYLKVLLNLKILIGIIFQVLYRT